MNNNNLDHLAIIMDGNGRWALDKGLDRNAGHAAGEHSLSNHRPFVQANAKQNKAIKPKEESN